MRSEPLLRLRFAGVLAPEQRLGVVRQMREALRVTRGEVRERLEVGEFDDPFHRMTAEFGLAYSEWGRDWCADAERRLLAEGCLGRAASPVDVQRIAR